MDVLQMWLEEIQMTDTKPTMPVEPECQYRIKPKPDVVHPYYVDDGELIKCEKTIGPCEDPHDLRVTFDGKTKKLKYAEVIK
jgi:hypothetical protein